MAENQIFMDTTYALALVNVRDFHHQRAVELAEWLTTTRRQVVTTQAVVLEIGNFLPRLSLRHRAIPLLQSLLSDPLIEVVPLSDERFQRAVELFIARPDKEWGLVDCVSFVVMEERNLIEALTSDGHFRKAVYTPLMT